MTKTTVASVGKTSSSVRTVIPMWIAEMLGLEKGSTINWTIVPNENGGYSAQFEGGQNA
jgi:hypothetical protein